MYGTRTRIRRMTTNMKVIEQLTKRVLTRIPTRTPRRRMRMRKGKRREGRGAGNTDEEDDGEGWGRKDVWKGLWIKREAAVHDLASPAGLDCPLPGQPPESNAAFWLVN